MHDSRIDALAQQLANYSLQLQANEKVLIDLYDTPEEVAIALIRATRERGAIPFVRTNHSRITRELLHGATEEQYSLLASLQLAEMQKMDAYLAIRGSSNISESSDVPSERTKLAMKHLRAVIDHRVKKTKWCVLRWPSPSMAQQANMSTEAFENFYFRVCLLDYPSLLPAMNALKAHMERAKNVRIISPGTDLRFSIENIPAIVCGGNMNIPDGEVFTAPVKNSVNGTIRYNAPTIYQGIAFDDVEFTFENGKIISAKAGAKTDELNRILDSDEGARYIGEFALGFHPEIREPMRDILFDEKIAGSFHFTPGQAYEEADNGNRSQVHWDLVCIQRPEYGGGQIYFDDVLIRDNGQFLPSDLIPLNYQP